MSDLAMYEALASSAIRRHGKSGEKLAKCIAHMVRERDNAVTEECRQGFDLVLERLRERLGQLDLPLQTERG